MRSLTAAQLLDAWEGAAGRPPVERALALLAVACPEPVEQLAALPIGQRDALLFELREQTFGAQLSAVADCPNCGERLEFAFEMENIRQLPEAANQETVTEQGMAADSSTAGTGLELVADGCRVWFRLPGSADLLAVQRSDDPRRALIERCILQASDAAGSTTEITPASLSSAVIDALAQAMAGADPLADLHIEMACQRCGQSWNAPFDIAAYFWSEIETWAHRTLLEVHRLALAYGWSQTDILQLSAWRRQYYLQLI